MDSGIDSLDGFSTNTSNHMGEVYFLESSDSSSNTLLKCPNVSDCGFQNPETHVLLSCLDCFSSGGFLQRFMYEVSRVAFLVKFRGGTFTLAQSNGLKTVIHRAMYLLNNGFGKYDLLENNCKDFALYCKTGILLPPDNNKAPIKGGQVYGVVGATLVATCSSLVQTTPIGMAAIGDSLYSMSRICNDIGVKNDAIKVEVEDMVKGLKERAKANNRRK